jgi:Fe-S cluster assembly ATPase SufC
MADILQPPQPSLTYGVRWSNDLSINTNPTETQKEHDLLSTWHCLADQINEAYKEFELLNDYLPMIERKINEALSGEPKPDDHLMELANQLEDLLNAMDIEKSLRRSASN